MKALRSGIFVLLFLAAVLPHVGGLRNGFVYDDRGIILENRAVREFSLPAIWGGPYWPGTPQAGLYRPVVSTSFATTWALFGNRPAAFVATNILLHAVTTLLILGLLRRMYPQRSGLATAATFLFAVHPIHVEAVVGVVGQAEILAALLLLLAYRAWLGEKSESSAARRVLPAALWLLAVLAKESAVALPGLLLLHRLGWLGPRVAVRRFRATDLAWPIALLVVVALRVNALGPPHSPEAPYVQNPLASLDPIRRALGAGGVLARQILQILTLRGYSCDYSFAQVNPGVGLYAAGGALLLMLAAGALAALTRGRDAIESWGAAFFICTWIVSSNLLVPIGTPQADRLLYLPLLGILLAGLGGAERLVRRLGVRHRREVPVAALVLCCAVVSFIRVRDWHDDLRLFTSAVREAPRSVKARMNLAMDILQKQTAQAATEALRLMEPVLVQGADYGPLNHAEAKAWMFIGDDDRAMELFKKALRNGADSARVLVEMGNIELSRGNGQEALGHFDAAARTHQLVQHTSLGRASALSLMRRFDEAAATWRPIMEALPDSVPIRIAYAWNLRAGGRPDDAATVLRAGMLHRNDSRLWDSLARTLLGLEGRQDEAVAAALRAVRLRTSPETLTTLARAQLNAGRPDDASATLALISDPDSSRVLQRLLETWR